jgi:peptide/nickel transport system substrate-binding protein
VKFQNGEPFNAQPSSSRSTAPRRQEHQQGQAHLRQHEPRWSTSTRGLLNKEIDPDFLFVLGQATAIIVEPKSAATNATKPVGTGPYKLGPGTRAPRSR